MALNPPIRLLLIVTTVALLLCGVCGWTQNPKSSEIAGIELSELRTMGYRIDWMNQSITKGLRLPTITSRSLYTLDNEDNLTRYDLRSGQWLWSTPVGNQVFELRSINESAETGRVYVVSDGAVYIVETASGNYPALDSPEARKEAGNKPHLELKWVANTPAILLGGILIYGSNTGETVWFDPRIGFIEHRYRIGTSVKVSPTLAQGVRDEKGALRRAIITPAADGSMIAVDASQINRIWMLKLLDEVETPIACTTSSLILSNESFPRTSVFIAGTDQYLRSVDLHSGKPRWKILTSSPLSDTPVIYKELLFQRIPNSGLACFEAFPESISGEMKWIADDVFGNVITTTNSGQLVCWDNNNKVLQIVDTRLGGVVSSLSLPTIRTLIADKDTEGSLYIITEDDMLLRLVSRYR